jgi:hypothetical protein
LLASLAPPRAHRLPPRYTNTPLDNHFKGTDPFIVTDPTVERAFLQKHVMPFLHPIILVFALWGNYSFHLTEIIKGNEKLSPWKLFLPSLVYVPAYERQSLGCG